MSPFAPISTTMSFSLLHSWLQHRNIADLSTLSIAILYPITICHTFPSLVFSAVHPISYHYISIDPVCIFVHPPFSLFFCFVYPVFFTFLPLLIYLPIYQSINPITPLYPVHFWRQLSYFFMHHITDTHSNDDLLTLLFHLVHLFDNSCP